MLGAADWAEIVVPAPKRCRDTADANDTANFPFCSSVAEKHACTMRVDGLLQCPRREGRVLTQQISFQSRCDEHIQHPFSRPHSQLPTHHNGMCVVFVKVSAPMVLKQTREHGLHGQEHRLPLPARVHGSTGQLRSQAQQHSAQEPDAGRGGVRGGRCCQGVPRGSPHNSDWRGRRAGLSVL